MSTSYYHLSAPITSIRLEEGHSHDRVTIFETHANTGTLTFSKGIGRTVVSFFADEVDDNICPIRTHFGGKGRGCIVTIQDQHLHDDMMLVSEYGQPFTVKQIKEMDGKGA